MSKSIIKQKRILTKAAGGSSLATPVSVANGGTGIISYTIGDLIYASGATTLSKLADVATGNALISGGVGTAPSWGKIGLTTHITGGNWKTIYTNGSGVVTELALGSSGQVLQSNGASSAPTWVTPSSGITIGGTAITSGTDYRVLFQDATASDYVTQTANFTMGSVATGVLDVPVGLAVGGTQILKNSSSSLFLGTGTPSIGGTIFCTFIGHKSGFNATTPNSCTFVGHGAGALTGASIGCIYIGYNNMVVSSSALTGSITMGYEVAATASHQGVLGGNNSTGYVDNWYFNGVTHTSAYSVNLRACGGSGSNNVAANLNFYVGLSTGSGTPATMGFYSSATGASSSTAQTAVKVLEITNSTSITVSDSVNFLFNTGTGTKLGTATTQKIGFWGVTPVTQYATTGTTTGFTANASANTLFNESTFTGDTGATAYTISDLVKALKLCGIILA